jgi:hypothetical protein
MLFRDDCRPAQRDAADLRIFRVGFSQAGGQIPE